MRATKSPVAASIPTTTTDESVQDKLDLMEIPTVKHAVTKDIVVLSGQTCFHSNTELCGDITLEIQLNAEFMVLS